MRSMEEIAIKKSDRLLGWLRSRGIRHPVPYLRDKLGKTRSTVYEWLSDMDAGDVVKASRFIEVVREIDPAAVDQVFR